MVKTKLQVGIKICLYNREGKIILVRRSSKYSNIAGQWDIPGGRINPGTSLISNLRRELKEELGIDWKGNTKLIYAQDIIMPDRHVVRLTYTGRFNNDLQINLDKESTEFSQFSIADLKKLKENELDKFVRELLRRKLL